MAKRLLSFCVSVVLFVALASSTLALDKVKLGSSVKMVAHYYLPPLTAEEKGFWKEHGLEVEWVPFVGTVPQMRAVAAGEINIGMATAPDPALVAERGLPVIMVAELVSSQGFNLWVRGDGPYRNPRDLKGARVGVTTLGGPMHAFGRIITSAHGMEKEVRFVGAGGVPEMLGGLRSGAFDAIVTSFAAAVGLKLQGIARDIAATSDYVPKPWFEQVIFARKDFARGNPDVVRKLLKATLQSLDFIRRNPGFTQDKIKSFQGLSEAAAKLVYEDTKFTITGKLDRKAVENVRKVYIEYGIITEKAPAVEELFTNEYIP